MQEDAFEEPAEEEVCCTAIRDRLQSMALKCRPFRSSGVSMSAAVVQHGAAVVQLPTLVLTILRVRRLTSPLRATQCRRTTWISLMESRHSRNSRPQIGRASQRGT